MFTLTNYSKMQRINNINNLFSAENMKFVEINNFADDSAYQKNLLNGIQNARNTINDLERSLRKSNKYEKKLLQCRASHIHSHDTNEWWDSDISHEKGYRSSKTEKSSRSQVDMAESWSTMSIVCLQYQYEELSKRYESLLQAYNERSGAVVSRDVSISELRQLLKMTHAQLTGAHQALLSIGDKYLALRRRKNAQGNWYEKRITSLKRTISEVLETAERARLDFDSYLSYCLAEENDSEGAVLLAEIRKCNYLFLENLKLKAQLEKLAPKSVQWEN